MLPSWRRRIAATLAIHTASIADRTTLQRSWGAVGLSIGGVCTWMFADEIILHPTPDVLASLAFLLRALTVALIGAWIAWRLPWRPIDELAARLGYALNVTCCLLLLPTIAPIVLEPEPVAALGYYLPSALTLLQIIWLSRRGLVRIGAGTLTLNLIFQVLGLTALDTDLGRAGIPFAYSMVVLVAGLLVRWWLGVMLALVLPLCIAALGWLALIPVPPHPVETVVAILALTSAAGMIALYTRALDRALEEARTDAKTGLLNARYIQKAFLREFTHAERHQRPLTLIMADLDFLREINNNYGHLAGDAVISGVGDLILAATRSGDSAGRFGGEEFAIVLPNTDCTSGGMAAERIRAAINRTVFSAPQTGAAMHATMSFGVACFPHDAATAENLYQAADRAVYRAKALGRNRVVFAADLTPNEPTDPR